MVEQNMSVRNLIDQVLYERERKSLIIFYKVDVAITESPEMEQELKNAKQQQAQPPQPAQPQPAEQGQEVPAEQIPLPPGANEETIYEETFTSKRTGKLTVKEDDVDNIQSLEDMMDYITNVKIKGAPVIDEAITEIVMNVATGGGESIGDLVNKEDKILINVDYGKDKDNSIGFKVLKSAGSHSVSLVMKKDNKVFPGTFNLQEFNKQLVFFRNSVLGA